MITGNRCLCGRFIGTDGCGTCLHYVCARCKKVADHTNGTTDHSELCDACWSAEFADALEAAGIVSDDKWITQWDGSRLAKDADRSRIEVMLTAI